MSLWRRAPGKRDAAASVAQVLPPAVSASSCQPCPALLHQQHLDHAPAGGAAALPQPIPESSGVHGGGRRRRRARRTLRNVCPPRQPSLLLAGPAACGHGSPPAGTHLQSQQGHRRQQQWCGSRGQRQRRERCSSRQPPARLCHAPAAPCPPAATRGAAACGQCHGAAAAAAQSCRRHQWRWGSGQGWPCGSAC